MDVYFDQGKIDVYLGEGLGMYLPAISEMYDRNTLVPLGKQFILGLLEEHSSEPFRAGFLPSLVWEEVDELHFGIHPQYLQHAFSSEPTHVNLDVCGFSQGSVTLYGTSSPFVHERLKSSLRQRE